MIPMYMRGALPGLLTIAGRGCVAALALALVLHGSTKRPSVRHSAAPAPSAAESLRSPAPTVAPCAADLTDSSLPADLPPVADLRLWGIERGEESVALGIAWPASMSFANDRIDIFGSHLLADGGWWRLAQLDVSRAASNAVAEFAYADLPTNAMRTAAFFRLASQDDADGDGLSDGVEKWVLGTDSLRPDTDGDGLADGEELGLGTSPLSEDSDGDGIPIAPAEFASYGTHSEIRMTRTRAQLVGLGLLPSQDEDGVDEMAWVDIVQTDGQSLLDSEAFSTLSYAFRGMATRDTSKNLETIPPNSVPSATYLRSAGCEILTVTYGDATSGKRQIMNQADVFYYSGHGNGSTGGISGGFSPDLLGGYWKRDLNCVVIAGCSVLNIAGHRIKSFGMTTRFKRWCRNQRDRSVGSSWESAADIIFLGYCYTAPLDSQGAVDIASDFAAKVKGGMGYLQAWKEANDRNAGRNACAIDCTTSPHSFWYWDETSGNPVWTRINKGATSW